MKLSAVLGTFLLVPLCLPVPAAQAGIGFYTSDASGRVRADYIRIDAAYELAPPDACPAVEPGYDDPQFDAYWASLCSEFRAQSAEMVVKVRLGGKVVREFNTSGSDGVIRDARAWRFEIEPDGACRPRHYEWRAVLLDPYGRGDVEAGRGAFFGRCGDGSSSLTANAPSAAGGSSTPRTDVSPEFYSPSRNIACWTAGPKTLQCAVAVGNRGIVATIEGSGRAQFRNIPRGNAGDIKLILAYGKTWRRGGFACTSRVTGMTCWRVATGHGFFLSRESQNRVRV